MKKNLNSRMSSLNWWRGLHLLMALSTPILLAALLSCERPKEEKEKLGPEIAPKVIDEALNKAIGPLSLADLKVGQFAEYVTTQRIENEEGVNSVAGSRVDVIKREETATQLQFTLRVVRTNRLSNGQWETKVTEQPLVIDKGNSLVDSLTDGLMAGSPPVGLGQSGILGTSALAKTMASNQITPQAGKTVKRTTFHKLRESTGTLPPPAKVRMRADCGGVPNCTLPARFVSFDLVQWFSDTDYQKIALDFAFSSAPPFLPFGADFEKLTGVLAIDCRAMYIPVEGRNIYVRECTTLEDFQK